MKDKTYFMITPALLEHITSTLDYEWFKRELLYTGFTTIAVCNSIDRVDYLIELCEGVI